MKITKRQLIRIIKEEMDKPLDRPVVPVRKDLFYLALKNLHAAADLLEENPEANKLVWKALDTLQNEAAKADGTFRAAGDPSYGGQGGH